MPDARLSISSLTNQEPAKRTLPPTTAPSMSYCNDHNHSYPYTPPSPSEDEHSPRLKKRRTDNFGYPTIVRDEQVSNCRTCTLPNLAHGLPNPLYQHHPPQHQHQHQFQPPAFHPPSPSPSSPGMETRVPSPVLPGAFYQAPPPLAPLPGPALAPSLAPTSTPPPNPYYSHHQPPLPQIPFEYAQQLPQYYPNPPQQYYYPTPLSQPPTQPQQLQQPTRRKKQCPQCLKFFSNLATHKSTHLSEVARPHTCVECGRGFARPNDLFRHLKSHRGDAPFRCPFHSSKENQGDKNEPQCHQTGGFSRCDTYKNHLKAMHFEYPVGTKKKDRHGQSGCCRGCGMHFDNVDEWISSHVETRHCRAFQ